MKVQMVVLANASEQRGRSLMGILCKNGKPLQRFDRPHWLRPVIRRERPFIPKSLIVDVLPLDLVSFDLLPGENPEVAGGTVEVDLYSLQIIGRLTIEELESCCPISGFSYGGETLGDEIFGHEISLILACECSVVVVPAREEGEKESAMLRFGYNGYRLELPLRDPQFLETFAVVPEVLDGKRTIQLVLSQSLGRKVNAGILRVASVLV